MRITRLVVPIALISALVILGGATAGLILAREQAPSVAQPEAAVSLDDGDWGRQPEAAPMKSEVDTSSDIVAVSEASRRVVQEQAQWGQEADPALPSASGGPKGADPAGDEDSAIQISAPDKADLKYPNLGSTLDQMVVRVENKEVPAQEAAVDAPVRREESVAVTIYLSGNVDDVVSFLEDNGGDPRNVGEDYIEAYAPVTLLGQVSERPGVIRVRAIIPPEPGRSAQPAISPVHTP